MTTKLKTVPTKDLIPYARNSRTHSDAQVSKIAASIREFGFLNPIIVDGKNGIIAGHGRVMAAQKLGLTDVPVIEAAHLTDAQKRAYVIADNRLALDAGWDDDLLRIELSELSLSGFDLTLTGFDTAEIASLFDVPDTPKTDEDEVPLVPDTPASLYGDVWLLGKHRVMCGDSTSAIDLALLMDTEQADLVWTDPPYNVAIKGKAGTIINDDMDATSFRGFLTQAYTRMHEAMRPGAIIYVAHADTERVAFTECFKAANLKLSQVLIWAKQSGTLSRQDFNWKHEPILYGWKEGAAHYFCRDFTLTTVIDDDIDITKLKRDDAIALLKEIRNQEASTLIRHDRPTRSELHPTMKPVSLVQRMIEWSSRETELCLDLFGGSGSTLIACQKTNRRARLMELDPKYCDVIVKRWQDYTGQQATLEATGQTFADIEAARCKAA